MNEFKYSLKEILNNCFNKKESLGLSYLDSLRKFKSGGIKIHNLKQNDVFIKGNDPLEYIYILAKGTTYIVNYTQDGRRVIADTLVAPQIFGLIEAVNGDLIYKSTVITLSKSLLISINKEFFLDEIYKDIEISSHIIKYLSSFTIHSMNVFENKTTISPYDNLIIYLYNKTLGEELPFRIRDKKSFIADFLNVDKRTIYRYLNQLTKENIISREKQDILINNTNFENIQRIFLSLYNI